MMSNSRPALTWRTVSHLSTSELQAELLRRGFDVPVTLIDQHEEAITPVDESESKRHIQAEGLVMKIFNLPREITSDNVRDYLATLDAFKRVKFIEKCVGEHYCHIRCVQMICIVILLRLITSWLIIILYNNLPFTKDSLAAKPLD